MLFLLEPNGGLGVHIGVAMPSSRPVPNAKRPLRNASNDSMLKDGPKGNGGGSKWVNGGKGPRVDYTTNRAGVSSVSIGEYTEKAGQAGRSKAFPKDISSKSLGSYAKNYFKINSK